MSEPFEITKPIHANQNVRWFRLGGETKNAILRTIELNNQQRNASIVSPEEVKSLAGTLGLKFRVARSDVMYGLSAHAPEIFESPFPNEKNSFYMMAPVGLNKSGKECSFIPEDSVELTEEETYKLEKNLFSNPWSSSIPLVRVAPIPVQLPNSPEA